MHRSIPSVESCINIVNNLWRRNHTKNLETLRVMSENYSKFFFRCAAFSLYTFLLYMECIQYNIAICDQMHSFLLYITAGNAYPFMLFVNCHTF